MADRASAGSTAAGLLQRLVSRNRSRIPVAIAARLTFDQISHRYGDVQAVSDFSLDVAPGEIVCLLGQSGCGKTTLLRLAAGVETPTAGRILLNGQDVSSGATMLPPEERGIGLVFQDFALFPHLSNLENVMFGLRALPRGEAEREARQALDRVGLASFASAYPHMLSGGEQQRVALARAVAPRPNVLLMDEPFSGLDRRLRAQVREDTLAVLREARVTCIVVTHDPEEALRLGDRIALMRAGTLVQVSDPETIYREPRDLFVAQYFCELNEIAGQVKNGRVETPVGTFAARHLAEGARATVAIRPEGIHLKPAGQGIPGQLQFRRFLGEVELLEIAVNGTDAPLKARVRGAQTPPLNSEIGVEIDSAEVLVFAASEA